MEYDYLVIAGYFALMVAISLLFKKMASNSTSDYFRGGGKMLWWMVDGGCHSVYDTVFSLDIYRCCG